MNIVVLVKQVPDSGSERKLDPADNTVARASADNVINEMDEYAIEEALTVRDAQGGEVTVLTVGPDSATDAIRKALSMGADKAVHVVDEAIHGSCAVQTSAVIAAALQQLEYDLILCGAESTDGQVSVMPALLSERLGIPQLSGARKLTVEGGTAKVERHRLSQVRSLQVMDVTRLGFPDETFDAVTAQFLITLVPDPEAALTEFARVLRPGGEIVLANHFGQPDGAMARVEEAVAPLASRIGWSSDFKASRIETWARGTGAMDVVELRSLFPSGFFKLLRLRKRRPTHRSC